MKAGGTVALKGIVGDALELGLQFQSPSAKEFGIDVLCDDKGENGMRIAMIPERKIIQVGGVVDVPFELKKGEDLTLRIFIDKCIIDVFANDRQAVMVWDDNKPEEVGFSLFSKGGEVTVKDIKAWTIKSIYDKK